MNIESIIAIAVIAVIIAGVIFYIYKSKKRGQKCIGCPYSKACKGSCDCSDDKN